MALGIVDIAADFRHGPQKMAKLSFLEESFCDIRGIPRVEWTSVR